MEHVKISAFTDLIAWREGHQLVLDIYKVTQSFPREELFGLISQMRRAAVSVTSNIAEGFSRRNAAEKVQFYKIAQGSLTELQSQLMVARDVQFIDQIHFSRLFGQSTYVNKLIYGLISKLNTKY